MYTMFHIKAFDLINFMIYMHLYACLFPQTIKVINIFLTAENWSLENHPCSFSIFPILKGNETFNAIWFVFTKILCNWNNKLCSLASSIQYNSDSFFLFFCNGCIKVFCINHWIVPHSLYPFTWYWHLDCFHHLILWHKIYFNTVCITFYA